MGPPTLRNNQAEACNRVGPILRGRTSGRPEVPERTRMAAHRTGPGYLGTLPGVAPLPPVPQSTPPLGAGRAVLQAVPGSAFFPELPP